MKTKTSALNTLLLTSLLALTACSSSDSNEDPIAGGEDPQAVTINGTAQAPGGVIAYIEQHKPTTLAVLDFLVPSSWAAITGLTPVPNATVELIRINDDGVQVGDVLATTTTDSNGQYTLELPEGVDPAPDLVVQIKGDTTALRAIVSGDTVDIDPVSEFILNTLINDPNVLLSSLEVSTVQTLVGQVADIDIDFSTTATLEDAETAIEESGEVTQVVTTETNDNPIVGAWYQPDEWPDDGSAPLPGLMIFYADGNYINYSQDDYDCIDGGVEYGTYSYTDGVFTVTSTVDENGFCGLTETTGVVGVFDNFVINEAANQIEVTTWSEEDQANEYASFARVTDGNPNSIVGAWDFRSASGEPLGIVFYPEGYYAMWQGSNLDANCASGGVEYGSYAFDGTTLSGMIAGDENNDCGLGEGPGAMSSSGFSISNGVLTIVDDIETVSANRVGATTAPAEPGDSGGNSGSGLGSTISDGITVSAGKARLAQTFAYSDGATGKQTTAIFPTIDQRVDMLEAKVSVDAGSDYTGGGRIETDIRLNYMQYTNGDSSGFEEYAVIRLRENADSGQPVVQVFFGASIFENGNFIDEVYIEPLNDGSAGPLVNWSAVDWSSEVTMSVEWKASEQSFVFYLNDQYIVIPISLFNNHQEVSSRGITFNPDDFSGIQIRSRVRKINAAGDSGQIAASYDDVRLDGVLFDDFSGTNLDSSKWTFTVQ